MVPVDEDRHRSKGPAFTRFAGLLAEFAGYSSAVLILVATLVICYAVLLRYFIGASTIWQTELSIYFLIYATVVGSAYGQKHGDHVNIGIVVERLPARAQEWARLVATVLGFVFVVVVAVLATQLWWEATQEGRHSGTAWNPPMTYPYFILPLGLGLLALQYLAIAVQVVHRIRTGMSAQEKSGQTTAG